jgi:hypothetical protein
MDFKIELASRVLRVVAMVALLVGLADAARLVGVMSGPQSPIALLGPVGFAYLATFCLARLFSAVGIWIGASWGSVLLVGSTVLELVIAITDAGDVSLDIIGYILRILMILAILAVFVLRFRTREQHD